MCVCVCVCVRARVCARIQSVCLHVFVSQVRLKHPGEMAQDKRYAHHNTK